jgi:hypothetical protein
MLHDRGEDEEAVRWLGQSIDPMAGELLQKLTAE